ncbi:RE1, partial [Symbiodinium sp. CCMP2456]
AIPKFIPGTTDVTEYSKKLEFLAAMWPKDSLSLLAPRAALLCEGSAFKKVAGLSPDKLKANDVSGVKLLVDTLGGSWGRTAIEQKYDTFEKAIFGTVQKSDELLAQGVSFEEVRAYILLRPSSLTAEDRKRIVVELDGQLNYKKVCASVRLLGSRFFADFQGQRGALKTKTYDAHMVEDVPAEEPERAYQASAPPVAEEPEDLDSEFVEAMVAAEDQDALQVQAFEEELEGFFQETPELQEALVSYLEARSRLLAKRKSRGFWPVQASKGAKGGKSFKGKGKGKSAKEQLLQRIARSHCRACGERGHWKAECPKFGKPGSKSEAATTVAQASTDAFGGPLGDEILTELPEEAITLAEVVHGHTPFLFSKKAIKQLGGLYLLDLAHATLNFTMAEVEAMTLQEHGQMIVTFGTKVRGRRFEEVLETDPAWVKWCLEHLADSTKHSHKVFLRYVERVVEQAESIETELIVPPYGHSPRNDRGSHAKAASKSRAAPRPKAAPAAEDDRWDMISESSAVLQTEVNVLTERMAHMENMMQQLVQHLSGANVAAQKLLKDKANVTEGKQLLRKESPQRDQVRRRLDVLQPQSVHDTAELPVPTWEPIFQMAQSCAQKDTLARMDIESPIVNDAAFDQALQQAVLAKNSLVRHGGFSPEQIVFGKSLRVPGSITSDEETSAHILSEGADLESELYRQKLELRCRARRAFMDADNSQAIRRASLRRSNPSRGPYNAGMWVLYWIKKSSPNRLAAGRWHGPAKVICSEGKSVIWLAHGTNIIRSAPENLRPASLREWQHLSRAQLEEPWKNVGGASSFLDLTGVSNPEPAPMTNLPAVPETSVLVPQPGAPGAPAASPNNLPDEVPQPEQELTPQVSQEASGVERDPLLGTAAPSDTIPTVSLPADDPNPQTTPIPDSDEGLVSDHVFVSQQETGILDEHGHELLNFTTVETSEDAVGPPLAEDNLPYILEPLCPSEHQAYCLEVPLKAKDMRRWVKEEESEQFATVAAASKRARAEVCVKDLTASERELFEKAKEKEISCWLQTSAIRAILRRKLNPEQILKSRWILTWKAPEEGEHQQRAKARLVVLGFQDPKLVEVMRDAPTLSREGRALVLQTIASKKFRLGSFDIKTAFLRGKADANNPLAMEPPKELRKALNLKDDEVCELLGNAYGRVDAPLLFYKELSQQLLSLGFIRHPLEPCVFLLYTQEHLHGILGMHVDDGVCGGDKVFAQKVEALQKTLPFGSRKHDRFTFTGIYLEQLSDYTIRANQGDYVRNIPQIDIGRYRRQTPDAEISEAERSKLRGLVGSLQYAVTHTRPDMAAKLGEIQSSIPGATVQTLLSANKVLREAQEQHQVHIAYLPIAVDRLTFVSFGDASFASSKSLSSHQGALLCATDERLLANQEVGADNAASSRLSDQAYGRFSSPDNTGAE